MEKTNLQNSTKVSRESRTFLIEESKNFKGLLKGNSYLFRGYKVEILDSYKDPSKKGADGSYAKGVKTLFEYKITDPNGTIIEGIGDNEKLRAKVGAKLQKGEGQKSKKTPIEIAEELIERLEALELLNLKEVKEQLEKVKEEKEREERERREKEEKEREERKKEREEIEKQIETLKKKMRELR